MVESGKKPELSAFSKVEKTGMIYLSEDITALGESPIELLFWHRMLNTINQNLNKGIFKKDPGLNSYLNTWYYFLYMKIQFNILIWIWTHL